MKREFTIDGAIITIINGSYYEIEKVLQVDSKIIDNWSLDVLDDVLEGGYRLYDLKEKSQ